MDEIMNEKCLGEVIGLIKDEQAKRNKLTMEMAEDNPMRDVVLKMNEFMNNQAEAGIKALEVMIDSMKGERK